MRDRQKEGLDAGRVNYWYCYFCVPVSWEWIGSDERVGKCSVGRLAMSKADDHRPPEYREEW